MVAKIQELVQYFLSHKEMLGAMVTALFAAVVGIGVFAEFIVRLTPTKTDDGALVRVSNWIKIAGEKVSWALDKIGLPNKIKEETDKLPKDEE